MPKSKLSKPKLALLIIGGLILLVVAGVAIWLQTPWAHSQAKVFAGQAKALEKTNEHDSLVKYQMAAFLSPEDRAIENAIADLYLRRNRPDAAISALRKLPKGEGTERIALIQFRQGKYDQAIRTLIDDRSGPAIELTAKSLMEKGQGSAAVELLTRADTDEAAVLMAMAEASLSRPVTNRSVSSPEAVETIKRVRAGKLPLAQELYSRELLHSSQLVLESMAEDSTMKYQLLANINLAIQPAAKENLQAAQAAAKAGLKLDPSNRALRRLLIDADQRLGQTEAAKHEESLLKALSS